MDTTTTRQTGTFTSRYTDSSCRISRSTGWAPWCDTHRCYILAMATGDVHQRSSETQREARDAALAEYERTHAAELARHNRLGR